MVCKNAQYCQPQQRGDDVGDQPLHHGAKRVADDNRNSKVKCIAFDCEGTELCYESLFFIFGLFCLHTLSLFFVLQPFYISHQFL